MLTREETAKVFAMYLGQYVIHDDGEIAHLVGVVDTYAHLIHLDTNSYGSGSVDYVKLLLTPLSAITDEQILELCKVYAPTIFGDYRYNKWAIEQDGVKSDTWDVVNIKRKNDGYVFQLDKIDGELRLYDEDMVDTSSINHYYQQWYFQNRFAVPLFFSIDHPANGKTAIDLGIAIIKQ